jgi:hypothetical protein
MKTKRTIWLAVVVMLAVGINASAGIVTFEMGYIFEGPGIPFSPGPWVIAEFDDGDTAGTVDLTIEATNLGGINEKIAKVFFNLDPILDPAGLNFSLSGKVGDFADPTVSLSANTYQADGDGIYDILIDFDTDTAGAFNGGESVLFSISYAGITAGSFDYMSLPGGGKGPFPVAAHLLGLGEDQNSAWATVPEPATMLILGLGSVLLRKRK